MGFPFGLLRAIIACPVWWGAKWGTFVVPGACLDGIDVASFGGAGLGKMETANVPGAQTERRGEAWAGEGLAWRQNLTGRFFLARHERIAG